MKILLLPDDVFHVIFSYINNMKFLKRARLVCKRFRNALRSAPIECGKLSKIEFIFLRSLFPRCVRITLFDPSLSVLSKLEALTRLDHLEVISWLLFSELLLISFEQLQITADMLPQLPSLAFSALHSLNLTHTSDTSFEVHLSLFSRLQRLELTAFREKGFSFRPPT